MCKRTKETGFQKATKKDKLIKETFFARSLMCVFVRGSKVYRKKKFKDKVLSQQKNVLIKRILQGHPMKNRGQVVVNAVVRLVYNNKMGT